MVKSGIYGIFNPITKKVYIGRSVNLDRRWSEHKSMLRLNKHKNKHLQAAWNIHNEWTFEFVILEIIRNKTKLIDRELFWMRHYRCIDKRYGYNVSPSADGPTSIKRSEETKLKLSIANLGKKLSPETIAKLRIANLGKKATNRDRDKWPCVEGCKCYCKECVEKRRIYNKSRYDSQKLSLVEHND